MQNDFELNLKQTSNACQILNEKSYFDLIKLKIAN